MAGAGRARTARCGTLVAIAAMLALPQAAAHTETVVPPSGAYLEPRSEALFDYDNQTGLLLPTGDLAPGLCVGAPEQRSFGAGVCVDIDATPNGRAIDAASQATLVGEWFVASTLEVGGRTYSTCQPACYGDAVPGITYLAWQASHDDVCHGLDGLQEARVSTEAWEPLTGLRLSASETTTLDCPE